MSKIKRSALSQLERNIESSSVNILKHSQYLKTNSKSKNENRKGGHLDLTDEQLEELKNNKIADRNKNRIKMKEIFGVID